MVAWRLRSSKKVEIEKPHEVVWCNFQQSLTGKLCLIGVALVTVKEGHQLGEYRPVLLLFSGVDGRHGEASCSRRENNENCSTLDDTDSAVFERLSAVTVA